ncbi:MAG: radical SAM protein [Patescibacteria group bacterium]|jgi:MoaA/NifB/PqqE/SkfB family radical SAM enzyme
MKKEKKKNKEVSTSFTCSVQILVTNHCNYGCPFCVQGCPNKDLEKDFNDPLKVVSDEEITYQRLSRVFERLVSLGVDTVTLTGGEPLIYPMLVTRLLRKAKEQGLATSLATLGKGGFFPLVTSLVGVPKKIRDKTKTVSYLETLLYPYHSLDKLKLSVHGLLGSGVHDQLIASQYSPYGVEQEVQLILEEHASYYQNDFILEITTVVVRQNYDQILEIGRRLAKYSVSHWTLSVVQKRGLGITYEERIEQAEVERLYEKLTKDWVIKNSGMKVIFRKPEPACILVYPSGKTYVAHHSSLSGLRYLGNILQEGDVETGWEKYADKTELLTNYMKLNPDILARKDNMVFGARMKNFLGIK